jgi:lambda repressor-like predicted transcriptional regulator
MRLRSRIVEAIKATLRARGVTYAALARQLSISEATVKRMFSRASFSLARTEEILALLDIDLQELGRLAREGAHAPAELSHEQELALAKDEQLLSVFWLIQNGRSFAEIRDAFSISRAELTGAFARLDRLGLITWGPGERSRLRVRRDFRWRDGGPVKKAYGRRVMREFLEARFKAPLELLRFESRVLSADSAAILKRRLERLVAEFNQLAEADSASGARRVGIALLAACRPWEFSVVNALKRRVAPG